LEKKINLFVFSVIVRAIINSTKTGTKIMRIFPI
jgi:hypothetical protein